MESGMRGHIDDYPGGKQSGKGGGVDSGPSQDRCQQAIHTRLEEVANCDYYTTNNDLPAVGEDVNLMTSLTNGRLSIECDGNTLGYLPTKYNYLVGCMGAGYVYLGNIVSSAKTPVAMVSVDLAPHKK